MILDLGQIEHVSALRALVSLYWQKELHFVLSWGVTIVELNVMEETLLVDDFMASDALVAKAFMPFPLVGCQVLPAG